MTKSTAVGEQITIKWVPAVSLDELWVGDVLDVETDGEQVMLAHLDEDLIKAYQGICPHQEVLLATGNWDPDSRRLVCAGHNWEFDLNSGRGCNPAEAQLYEYPVRVRDGVVEVGVPQDGGDHHNRCTA
jgi:toluene monooxygenase system ferredoxin subunit